MVSGKSKLVVRDLGWARIVQEMNRADGAYTEIGIPEKGSDTTYDDGITVLEVAAFNEFGTRFSPERPAIRQAFDDNRDEIRRRVAQEWDKIVAGRATVQDSLERLGEWFTGVVRKSIRDFDTPPNAPSTIARKGSSNPLIDTGQYVQSIDHAEHV